MENYNQTKLKPTITMVGFDMQQTNFSDEEIESIYKLIGQNVKYYRAKKAMTQLALSYEMGYKSVSLVSAAELCSDKKHFNIEHLYKISKILDVPIAKFFEPLPLLDGKSL